MARKLTDKQDSLEARRMTDSVITDSESKLLQDKFPLSFPFFEGMDRNSIDLLITGAIHTKKARMRVIDRKIFLKLWADNKKEAQG